MSDHRSRRIGRRTAERLLRGVPDQTRLLRGGPDQTPLQHGSPDQTRLLRGGPDQARLLRGGPDQTRLLRGGPDRARAAGHDRLRDLLAAASAPARDRELTGEQAAMAAFRDARLATAPQRRRPWMLKIALANLLTVKIAAVSAAAAGGIALAAAAGALPGQHREEPAPTPDTNVTTTSTTTNAPDTKPDHSASPSPSFKGLCQAYTAGAGSEHGKAHDNPAFSALITAAGGADRVPAFCADLLGDKPGKPGNPPGKPSPGKPDPSPGKPDDAPGKPTRSNR